MGYSGAKLAGAILGILTFIGSVGVLELSATIVAHDHRGKIGIIHLVASLVSLSCITLWATLYHVTNDPGKRQASAFLVTVASMFMYLGAVIALFKDPTARKDYLSGQAQTSGSGNVDYSDNVFALHPYYGLVFYDFFTISLEFATLLVILYTHKSDS